MGKLEGDVILSYEPGGGLCLSAMPRGTAEPGYVRLLPLGSEGQIWTVSRLNGKVRLTKKQNGCMLSAGAPDEPVQAGSPDPDTGSSTWLPAPVDHNGAFVFQLAREGELYLAPGANGVVVATDMPTRWNVANP